MSDDEFYNEGSFNKNYSIKGIKEHANTKEEIDTKEEINCKEEIHIKEQPLSIIPHTPEKPHVLEQPSAAKRKVNIEFVITFV